MPNKLREQYDRITQAARGLGIELELRPSRFTDRWEIAFHWTKEAQVTAVTPRDALEKADMWLRGYIASRYEEPKHERREDEDQPDSS